MTFWLWKSNIPTTNNPSFTFSKFSHYYVAKALNSITSNAVGSDCIS